VGFGGVPNERCSSCHKAELAEDTHATRMFDDPRWAATLETMDALTCITCHREHIVAAGGVTARRDFCFPCHDDVVEKRPSHKEFTADSCGNAGCHNYHDNTALNTAFLKRHFGEPAMHVPSTLPVWGSPAPLTATNAAPQYPTSMPVTRDIIVAWQRSIHAAKEVGCMDCHTGSGGGGVHSVTETRCERCHRYEVETFHAGKHGAPLKLNLAALGPDDARLPMKPRGPARPPHLGCAACHDPHSVDTRRAAVEACLTCHDDPHSKSFKNSKHYELFAAEPDAGHVGPQAVTCATCHMPRTKVEADEGTRVAVNHNNTFTLRPRDRMVKEVCLACHGLEFAMNSVFDDRLVENNFQGRPARRHQTLEMIEAVVAEEQAQQTGEKR
jgi:predicted CXXCH cytochrome family protein